MTMWLVRRGTDVFFRDLEKDGDADLDHVYFEQDPCIFWLVGEEQHPVSAVFLRIPGRRTPIAGERVDKPIHNFVPTGESIDFDLHTITREQYQARG